MSSALRTEAALSCIVQDDRDIRAFVATLPDSAEREALNEKIEAARRCILNTQRIVRNLVNSCFEDDIDASTNSCT